MDTLAQRLACYKTIALIGMAKNAGKTTALNRLINDFSQSGFSMALTSIGRDGEELDLVTATAKPGIYVPSGSVIVTTEGLLAYCDTTLEILSVTDIGTPVGRVVIIRALSDGFVQIGGPSTVSRMAEVVNVASVSGADKIIIDGAISRKSTAAPVLAEAVVLCTGASLSSDMDSVINETRHVVRMFGLPKYDESAATPLYIQGAVTDAKMKELTHFEKDLKNRVTVADDPSKMLISPPVYEKFKIKGGVLAVKKRVNLIAVTVNPTSPRGFSFPPKVFLENMRKAVSVPVYDVLQEDSDA